jgi:hypothetical protein
MTCPALTHGPHNPECTCPMAAAPIPAAPIPAWAKAWAASLEGAQTIQELRAMSTPSMAARGFPGLDSSQYDIEILPPSKWHRWRMKLLRLAPHWFNWLTNPTYRMLWRMAK